LALELERAKFVNTNANLKCRSTRKKKFNAIGLGGLYLFILGTKLYQSFGQGQIPFSRQNLGT